MAEVRSAGLRAGAGGGRAPRGARGSTAGRGARPLGRSPEGAGGRPLVPLPVPGERRGARSAESAPRCHRGEPGAARPPRAGGAREGRGEAAAAGRALPPLAAPYQPGLMLQGVSGDLLM